MMPGMNFMPIMPLMFVMIYVGQLWSTPSRPFPVTCWILLKAWRLEIGWDWDNSLETQHRSPRPGRSWWNQGIRTKQSYAKLCLKLFNYILIHTVFWLCRSFTACDTMWRYDLWSIRWGMDFCGCLHMELLHNGTCSLDALGFVLVRKGALPIACPSPTSISSIETFTGQWLQWQRRCLECWLASSVTLK